MDYSYAYSSSGDAALGILFSIIASFFLFFLVIGIVIYVFNGLSLYTMAKNKGLENPWLAWIPVAHAYLMGKVIDEKVAFGNSVIPYAHIALPVAPFASMILGAIPFIGFLCPIAYAVYYYAALYRLFKLYNADKAVLFLVLSIIFTFLGPIFLFTMRNNQPVEYLEETL